MAKHNESYTLPGIAAITNAVLTLPLSLAAFAVGLLENNSVLLLLIITVIPLILVVYILSSLQKFLNSNYKFYEADRYINLIIIFYIILSVLSVLMEMLIQFKTELLIFNTLLLIPYGIIGILLAIKLLKFPHNENNLIKPFAYTTLTTGVLMATVVLLPLSILTNIVSDLILGIIFLNSNKKVN